MNILIPMAGLGSRFQEAGITIPKPLIVVNGKTLIEHSVESLGIDGQYIFITKRYEDKKYNDELSTILKRLQPDCIEIQVDKKQYGAVDSCLYAQQLIDNDEELIITNCDQILLWDSKDFIDYINKEPLDGCVAVFKSSDPKNSYAKIYDGVVTELEEKKVVSNDALVGIHYWKHGKDFVYSGKKMMEESQKNNIKEAYVAPTYNYLISKSKRIVPYYMKSNSYICLGTPEDVDIYVAKVKEYYTEKPKTIFCDIDGTLIKHVHRFSHVGVGSATVLKGVVEKFNEWDSKGHKIILTTARKESARSLTEKQLTEIGLCWDQLIMGVTSGRRVLINDKHLETDDDRAVAINLITDQGFIETDWEEIGL